MAKRRLRKQLMSRRLASLLLDDFSFFGSLPFYIVVMITLYFIGNRGLFFEFLYALLIGFVVVIAIKNTRYRDRPQKEEFTIFMEKIVASSFPSTHSLVATTMTLFLALAYPYLWLIIMMSILSVMVYIQRYVTKKHFLSDIIGGIVLGVVIVVFVVKVF